MRLYNSLEDFLVSKELSVDVECQDGGGVSFPLKGREIEATVLFADITSFSKQTESLSSTATMLLVNKFIAWMSAEGLANTCGIVDKYIGDEILVVFSNEFGSTDHVLDALGTARRLGEFDEWEFRPHIGLASGTVTVGYTGTPLRYNCTVFGRPVTIAARCAAMHFPEAEGTRILMPAALFRDYTFEEVFPPRVLKDVSTGRESKLPTPWHMLPPRLLTLKDDSFEVLPIVSTVRHFVTDIDTDGNFIRVTSVVDSVEREIETLIKQGKYKPRTSS